MIAITGGPCAGKSTFMAKAAERCAQSGFQPLIVPEAATTFITGGMDPTSPAFQRNVLSFVLNTEDAFLRAAAHLPMPVILTDRGVPDQDGVYMSHEDYLTLGEQVTGLSQNEFFVNMRDKRYTAALVLRTAPREFYTTENNEARRETYEEAVVLDEKTMHAYVGAPHLRIIENRSDQTFDQKMNHALGELSRILGVPEPLEIEKRIRFWNFKQENIPEHGVAIDIVQTYLVSKPGITERVRARGQNGHFIYFHTIKEPAPVEGMIERERIISKREYDAFLIRRDLSCKNIHKTRYCFIYEGQYCELDVFHGHLEGLVIMEIEVPSMATPVHIPGYLGPHSEVTGDMSLSNFALSKLEDISSLPKAA